MPMLRGGHAVVKALQAEGVEVVFGLPGVQIMQLYDGFWESPEVRIISTRHEQATVYMADGYARTTGKIGVALVVPGPGLYNACAALSTAYAASSPVLLISGQVDSDAIGESRDALHQVHDQLEIVKPVTKWAHRVMHVEEIPETIHEAMRQLRTGRPRPVEIEIPPDTLAAVADMEILEPSTVSRPAANAADIGAATELLASSTHPVVFAGGGVSLADASEELQELVELLNAPVFTSAEGRGSISDSHPLAMGISRSFGATSIAGQVVPQADVVLAVGTRFAEAASADWALKGPQKLIHLDIDPDELGRVAQPTIGLAGDAKATLQQIIQALRSRDRKTTWDRQELTSLKASAAGAVQEALPRHTPVYEAMREAIGEDAIVLSGVTGLAYASGSALPVYKPRSWITSSYMGTLGYEFCTALGAKVGNPDRAVVAMIGDGGFMYSVGELATAVQYGINLVAVVYNNHAFGASNNDQRTRYEGRVIGTELHNPDFVKLAESFGARGIHVPDLEGIPAAVKDAVKGNKPTIVEVDVPTGEMPINLYGRPLQEPRRR